MTSEVGEIEGRGADSPAEMRKRHSMLVRRPPVWVAQLLIAVVILAGWQWLPDVRWVTNTFNFASPFFISSPSQIAVEIWHMLIGGAHVPLLWSPLAQTLLSALLGTALGIAIGLAAGLVLSSSAYLQAVARPYVLALNAVPRVAVIPIIVLIVASAFAADVITAFTVVVFLVFFNAFEGASTVDRDIIANVKILGAGRFDILWRVRRPLAVAWTFASIPNAIAFGLVGTVTTEIFTGSSGIGQLLIAGVDTSNATLTFAVVGELTIVGVLLVVISMTLRRRVLHWMPESSVG